MARKFCKHYRAMHGNETCNAGIAYKSLPHVGTKEFHDSCPCFGPQKTGECPSKVYPTPEEMEADDKMIAEMFVRTAKARIAIVESLGGPWKRGTPSASGAIDCPVCSGQKTLRFSRAGYNGHIHAGCSTDGCVRWIDGSCVLTLLRLIRETIEPQPEPPRCNQCGYTAEDAATHLDHHLCGGEIPSA